MCLRDVVGDFTKELVHCLFDSQYQDIHLEDTKHLFLKILKKLAIQNEDSLWNAFENSFQEIRTKLDLDALAAFENDPAAKCIEEIYLAYPGFYAIAVYRLSNCLLKLELPILPRMMSEFAHSSTGTDIHPGAEIGHPFFIDHATGIVIGETTIIKNNVSIYQGVTLGGMQVHKRLAKTKRHPTIENNVVIYANATILGGNVVIGEHSVIGANVCVTESIPPNSLVTVQSENQISQRK
ncbi:serine O-acetyltransferase EpsC [Polaribacter sp. HL-MS24]|uniref:serine O-acetyltransferase EpsC n=1 Tax=Polaribacter sp. HL-MS24 TaxID=3077735 RepID=UPI002934314B|nr:serine O-acetyltransferase EpsC [Polaribacter sp. HL-MS24]WOC39537.1 serine O-acetyltransferase EpsC [Polaribacter sp. HL-MS24]